jgi:hypothetical protein
LHWQILALEDNDQHTGCTPILVDESGKAPPKRGFLTYCAFFGA